MFSLIGLVVFVQTPHKARLATDKQTDGQMYTRTSPSLKAPSHFVERRLTNARHTQGSAYAYLLVD